MTEDTLPPLQEPDRAAFEAWVAAPLAPFIPNPLQRDPLFDDGYYWTGVQDRWLGWQAAFAAGVAAGQRSREGWQLVPVEPTVEMKIAGDNAGWWCADKYRAMLAAAPQPAGEQP